MVFKRKYIYRIVVAVVVFIIAAFYPLPISAGSAEAQMDIFTCEGMIKNHKLMIPALQARGPNEEVVRQQHDSMKTRTVRYKDTAKKEDKYFKMDIIDLVINGGTAAFGTVHMLAVIKDKFKGFVRLTQDYKDKILSKGKVMYSDRVFYDVSQDLYKNLSKDVSRLADNYASFAAYIGGVNEFSTAGLSSVLQDINDCYDRIEDELDGAYNTLWTYMQLRLSAWNSDSYYVRSIDDQKSEIKKAFDRWMCAVEDMHAEGKAMDGGGAIPAKYDTYHNIRAQQQAREKAMADKINKSLKKVSLGNII